MRESSFLDVVSYADGCLYWTQPVRIGINAGDRAGALALNGYRFLTYKRVQAKEHRIVWALHYGEISPGLVVDHINRQRADNRVENLRLLSNRENTSNWQERKLPVGITARCGRFRAQARGKGNKQTSIGTYDTVQEATAARQQFLETLRHS